VVRRLEQVDGVLAEVVRGDDERDPALTEQALTEDPLQRRLEPVGPVLGAEQPTQPGQHGHAGEDRRALVDVELEDLPRRQPGAERERDDAAGRGAGDEVEVLDDGRADVLLQPGEESRREDPAHSAAIQCEHLESIGTGTHDRVRFQTLEAPRGDQLITFGQRGAHMFVDTSTCCESR